MDADLGAGLDPALEEAAHDLGADGVGLNPLHALMPVLDVLIQSLNPALQIIAVPTSQPHDLVAGNRIEQTLVDAYTG